MVATSHSGYGVLEVWLAWEQNSTGGNHREEDRILNLCMKSQAYSFFLVNPHLGYLSIGFVFFLKEVERRRRDRETLM